MNPASLPEPTPHSSTTGGQLTKVCPSCDARYPGDFLVCPRDASRLEDIPAEDYDPLIGALIGDTFQITRLIGEGGMARVYQAHHVRLPTRRVAVKVLHQEYAQQPAVVARFQREAEAASGIGHPNVVDVFDVGRTPEGTPYLVCELLDGRDFAALLDEQSQLEAPAAVHIVRQVCRALTAAHEAGVVHRDVKPENVFLIGDPFLPFVKVLDFGISKFDPGGGGVSLTQTGMIMGTPGYMSPEQARGAKTDHRTDIYGVGAMLYRAVTGRLPFDAEDPSEVLGMVLTDEPRRPRSLIPELPEALELVIQKAMAKDPADRYQEMQELDEALAPFDPEMSASLSMLPPVPSSGPHSPALAPTMISTNGTRRRSSAGTLERASREAKVARPTLVALSVVAYGWTTACVVELSIVGFSLIVRDGAALAGSEKTGIFVIVCTLSITPVVFWVRRLVSIWKNSMHAVVHAQLLRRLMLAAVIPYAVFALSIRLFDDAFQGPSGALMPPVFSLLGPLLSYLWFRRAHAKARAAAAISKTR